jgi:hypothetical protein
VSTDPVQDPGGGVSEPRPFDADIPDFTAEQWAWVQARTQAKDVGYFPTRSLIDGL